MRLAMPEAEIRGQLLRQLGSLYALDGEEEAAIGRAWDGAMARLESCFSRIRNKYYGGDGRALFDPLHGCHWAHFLYALSRGIYLGGGCRSVCDKIYGLNRALNSVDLYYEVGLPDVFAFDHPLGSIMGRAEYSDYFSFSQGCTVGNNHGRYPRFGERVFMLSGSKVIGDCTIGNNVVISAGAYVKDEDVPGDSLVFGASPNLVVKESRREAVDRYAEGVFLFE